MKAVGGLVSQMATWQNVARAAWRAACGKRQRPEVRAFFANYPAEAAFLISGLESGRYAFGPYRNFPVRDPKTRIIHAPSFRDRVMHHAIMAVAAPVFEQSAWPHSYACRTGRGHHAAVRQARSWMRRSDWYLKLDVAKYYDSLPHDQLREALARRFQEARLLSLWDDLLASYETAPGRGLPIGALTSQFLGNFYLDACDHWMARHLGLGRHLRYMDDFLLLGDHAAMRRAQRETAEMLASLGLRVKQDGVLNRATCGAPFLGFVVYPDRIRLSRAGRHRLRRKLRAAERSWRNGRLSEAGLSAVGTALWAHASHGDDVAWRREVCRFFHDGETQDAAPCSAGRLVDESSRARPCGVPQQEQAGEPEQEQRFPAGAGPRHGGAAPPAVDAFSRASACDHARDETMGKSPADTDPGPQQGQPPLSAGAPCFQPMLPELDWP